MIPLALAALALVGAQADKTMLQQIVPYPTGKNGYEELIMAADVLRAKGFWTYHYYATSPQAGSGAKAAIELQAHRDLEGKTLLQRYRTISSRFAEVRPLLDSAARKDIFDPRMTVDFNTMFPELSHLRDLAKWADVEAYRLFADGQGASATSLMTTSLDVFDRTARGNLIQYLVGVACSAITIGSLESHLARISQKDAESVERTVLSILERPPSVRQCVVVEFQNMSAVIDAMLVTKTGAKNFTENLPEPDRDRALKTITALTDSELARLRAEVRTRYAKVAAITREAFSGDEAAWAAIPDPEEVPIDWSQPMGLADAFVDQMTPPMVSAGRIAATRRTQVRLLGLAASVIAFRWEHGRLPDRLETAVGKERAQDPLSKLPFLLRRTAGEGFEVVSTGTKETGEIALRYRRVPPTSTQPDPPNALQAR